MKNKNIKNYLLLAIKGFILGVANIIPGVSGGTLAITMGIYEELIETISHFFKNIKKNIKFILPLGIGAVLSILLMSKVISYSLDKFPVPTTLFFIGLIVGGIPLLTKKIHNNRLKPSNIAIFLLTFSIVTILALLTAGTKVISLANLNFLQEIKIFIVGIIAAATMVIPGVSGSFVLMLLGYYKPIVDTVSNLTNFNELSHNLIILIPFGLGIVIGIVMISKIIEYLFKKYEIPTYYGILGFVTASVLSLIIGLFALSTTTLQVLIGLVLFVLAFGIGYKLGDE